MIHRIKSISQVGSFRNFAGGGAVPFSDGNKITIIFARNTYGKTTFTQILKSLSTNNPELLIRRKSIPADPSMNQKVELTFKPISGPEENIAFSNNAWTPSILLNHIMIFDQDFVNSHVISGDLITRENRSNFTDFILGSSGVNLSNEIESKNKYLRDLKNNLKSARPGFLNDNATDADVQKFIDLQVSEPEEELTLDLATIESRITGLRESTFLASIPIPQPVEQIPFKDFEELKNELKEILESSFENMSDQAWQLLQSHLDKIGNPDSSLNWLKFGTGVIIEDDCPFCSQSLEIVSSLIYAYRSVFNEEYELYDATLSARISEFEMLLSQNLAATSFSFLKGFANSCHAFLPYVAQLSEALDQFDRELSSLQELEEIYRLKLLLWQDQSRQLMIVKQSQKHKSVQSTLQDEVQTTAFKTMSEKYIQVYSLQLQIKESIVSAISEVSTLDIAERSTHENDLLDKRALINKKLARIELQPKCDLYKIKVREIDSVKDEIDLLVSTLESDQSDFLRIYFTRLNYWFKRLGSNSDFEIGVTTNDRGDKKVYSIDLRFHGSPVAIDEITKIFSESDRRNLALSIFLAKVEYLGDDYILLFDDPVVSFDDNRRKITCGIMKELAPSFKQLILTTHYSSFVKIFWDQQTPATYLEIFSERKQSRFRALDVVKFTREPHQRKCEEIVEFLEGGKVVSHTDLRVFMEAHLRQRFQPKIRSANLEKCTLNELINFLSESNFINAASTMQLHSLRESFNPELHREGEIVNEEELRTEARILMELMYGPEQDW